MVDASFKMSWVSVGTDHLDDTTHLVKSQPFLEKTKAATFVTARLFCVN